MGTVQTSFNINHAMGAAGVPYGVIPSGGRESRIAAASIPFGTFVCRRASPADGADSCANPAASADVTARLLGVALHSETCKNTFGWVQYEGVSYLRKGLVWVPCETAHAEAIAPFIRFAAGAGGTVLGGIRNDADTASAVQWARPTILVRNVLAAAGLALVEINLPG